MNYEYKELYPNHNILSFLPMTYSEFTLRKVKKDFQLQIIEGGRFLPETEPVAASPMLQQYLENYLPWAIAVSSENDPLPPLEDVLGMLCWMVGKG